jgi:hypothetical protein
MQQPQRKPTREGILNLLALLGLAFAGGMAFDYWIWTHATLLHPLAGQ